jgi:hypothetical protein
MSGALQAIYQNQRSFVPPLPDIGSAYEGGFFAGQIGVSGVATHNLVVGPRSTAESSLKWKLIGTATPGADSVINGPQNTADMVADGDATIYPCAHFCNDLVIGGFSDWYMPARNELEVCYYNLKPSTTGNNTASGINPNAVPARASNYTTGDPAQTSAADFLNSGGAQRFNLGFYWTSTEFSAAYARRQYFYTGSQTSNGVKYSSFLVRAVRRVAV